MLIPSLYATSPRARSLRPVRVPSDQNTRWRLPHHFIFLPLGDKEFLVSPYLPDIYPHLRVDDRRDVAHVRHFLRGYLGLITWVTSLTDWLGLFFMFFFYWFFFLVSSFNIELIRNCTFEFVSIFFMWDYFDLMTWSREFDKLTRVVFLGSFLIDFFFNFILY